MTYLALARKWRPKTFAEVVGQTHVVQALSNALDSGRVHHAFLFTGTRGVGKTTLARIFAKSLNCEKGVGAEPCQQCDACTAIDEGRYVDLIEVDAASRTKVDDTRELLENVQYAPTTGKYKVYLIDEVHMLSGHSFNALLKTLEEPPEHVKFLFATTDPQKLPITVLSRCLQFNLRAMRPEQVENQLVKIVGSESIEFDQSALVALANAADGSMRDGLSLLDQAIAQGAGSVRHADVASMLGTINAAHSDAILKALASKDVPEVLKAVSDMADSAVDFSVALDEVLMELYHISLAQVAPHTLMNQLGSVEANESLIKELAESLDAQTVQLYYQIGLISKRDLALAPSLRVGFEMAMLRMIAFEPESDSGVIPVSSGERPNLSEAIRKPQKENSSNAAKQNTSPVNVQNSTEFQSSTPEKTNSDLAEKNRQQPTQQQTEIPHQIEPKPEEAQTSKPSAVAVTLAGNNEWGELIEQTALIGLGKELAMNCACEKISDEIIMLALAPASEHLFKPERLDEVQGELRKTLKNNDLSVEIQVEPSEKETPAECLERLGFEHQEQTKHTIRNDPGVRALVSEFGAVLNEDSIKPI